MEYLGNNPEERIVLLPDDKGIFGVYKIIKK